MTLWVPDLASGFVNAKQRSSTRMTTLYGFQPFTCGFGCKTAWFAPEWQDYNATSHHLWFCACKTAPLGLELQVSLGQRPHLCFFMQNSDFMTRLTSLLGFQPSPVVLSMQISNFSTWIASLYGSQPSPVVFACKTATSGPELLGSMGSSPHLWFCAFKTATLWPQLLVSMGPRPHLWFSACKTAFLASKLLVSMDPSPHLWFLHAKQRLSDPNSKSLCVPDITCSFVPPMQCD